MTDYILSIDQGTTSSRAILFDTDGQVRFTAQQEFAQHFPENGWVEHEPEQLWQSVLDTCRAVLRDNNIAAEQLLTIGITNQRETTLLWDRLSGEPVYNAIVWQDRRTADYCEELNRQGLEGNIRERTGLLIDPYFSATKLRWILNNVPDVRARAERGELAFGTVDTFLLWRLTGGQSHVTDASNASRTMLFNIHTQQWDTDLLQLFDIPSSVLPQVMDSSADFGKTEASILGQPVSIEGVAGDQQASLFGQACFHPGMAKSTYGTGCFMVANTGSQPILSDNRLLTTVAYRLNGQPTYALEGSIFSAGATVQWLRDGLKLISHASQAEAMTEAVKDPLKVFLVPAFTGLGAPYWDPNARGAILGLTRDTTLNDIVTAGLQAVGYQTKDLQKAMERDGIRPENFRVDGGMAENRYVLQFLANILGATVDRPQVTETTALGVAYLAGLRAGVFASLAQIEQTWKAEYRFVPAIDKNRRDNLYEGWTDAVARVRSDREGTTG